MSDDEALNLQTLSEDSLKNKRQWTFRESFTRSTANPSLEFILQHPSSAANPIRVVERTIDATKALTGTLSFNAAINTSGTDFSVGNNFVEDPVVGPPDTTIEYGGDYDKTAGEADALPVDIFDTGVGANRVARDTSRAAYRMKPGTSVFYDLDSQADSNNIIVEFVISEVPE
jgi:hypothetical protein